MSTVSPGASSGDTLSPTPAFLTLVWADLMDEH